MKKLLTIFFLLQFIVGHTQCLEGDCKNGTGTYKYEDGSIYIGEWKKGEWIQGTLTMEYGEKREGEFIDDELNGEGKITYSDGDIDEGEFKGNELNGEGKRTSKDGHIIEGKFKFGEPYVVHKITYKDGTFYEGKFKIKSFSY